MIIVLIGTSSSGKSSVSQVLQRQLGDGWLQFSVDGYLGMLGDKFLGLNPDNPEVTIPNDISYAKKHEDGTYQIIPGKFCSKLYATIPDVLETLAKQGFSIIVDSLIDFKEDLETYRNKLNPFGVLFVYLEVDESTMEQREKSRGNRLPGSAKHWLKSFTCRDSADMIIDTTDKSIAEIGAVILDNISQ